MHTPGPWIAEGSTVKAVSHGQWFKITKTDGLHHTKEANERNARLIAAAPELLEALEALFEHCAMVHKHWGENSNTREADAAIKAAHAAIAKAEGRQ